jgi:predicted nucleic acid-binding protein
MRFVIDTNVLLTYFWKGSVFRRVCTERQAELFAPEYILKEFRRYAPEVSKRAGVERNELRKICREALSHLVIIDYDDYSGFMKECMEATFDLDERERDEILEDLDFLAAAEMLCCPLWTSDKLLSKQKRVAVFSPAEVVSLLDL